MRRRGSFTVEAAMIMSVVWLAVFSMLYLCLFVHNRAWLTAAACEAAVCGSIAEAYREGSGYDTAELRSRELGSTGFFGASGLTADTSVQDCICVSYDMDTAQSFFPCNGICTCREALRFSILLRRSGGKNMIRRWSDRESRILKGAGEDFYGPRG